jgi:hypothetical protein
MPLQWNVATLDNLSPELAALYEADAEHGGYTLSVTEPERVTRALKAERDLRATAERNLRAAESSLEQAERDRSDAREARAQRDKAQASANAMRATILKTQAELAAREAGLHQAAIGDAVRAAQERFIVADDGSVQPREGAQGLADWLRAARDSSPHWYPATGTGMGSQESARRAPSSSGITRQQFERLNPVQRAAVVKQGVQIKD